MKVTSPRTHKIRSLVGLLVSRLRETDSLSLGDVHFYGYQDDSWNPNTYPITRFLSETGIQSLPSLDSWLEVTNNSADLIFASNFTLHREHSGNQLQAMMSLIAFGRCIFHSFAFCSRTHIASNLPLPVTSNSLKNFTQMIYLSQIHQAMTLKSISDVCRIHSPADTIDNKTSEG